MKTVQIIGVPEHFNLPWLMAIDDGAFAAKGIDLQWKDIPEGTGKMTLMLANGETDLAIILTEGIIKSISEGNPSKIVQEYIATPLLWGIHVAAGSQYNTIAELEGTKAAISRFGSGSHLMAYVNAQHQGWDTTNLRFEVVHNLEGAVSGLVNHEADYFMWEHFTTKPLVDNGTFRRLGDCPTPWPCFVVVATNQFLQSHDALLSHILETIDEYTTEFKAIPSIDRTLANAYGQQLQDVRDWLSVTEWSASQISTSTIDQVQETLLTLGLIKEKLPVSKILR